ncbi:YjbH domain-containing protein [Dyadobacter sp. 676]|uniref:YjbH domain-containing protein n=1 Tax=Dyadobacter sp. 676 TaxID=3088362 RepID=A0AAU8FE83_9BACT
MIQFVRGRRGNTLFPFLLALCMGFRVHAQTNISGKPGLIYIPSAQQTSDGAFQFGYHFNPIRYGFRYNRRNSEGIYFANLTVLPRLEINVNLLRINNEKKRGQKGIGDRQLDIKYLLFKETDKRPSVAIILSAPFGIDNSLSTNALVGSKTLRLGNRLYADVTAGFGSPVFIQRDESEKNNYNIFENLEIVKKKDLAYRYLSGPFGGFNLRFDNMAGFMAEWDSQHFNAGLYATLFKRWTIQAGVLNFDQVTFGTSYAVNMLRLPKRVRSYQDPEKAKPAPDAERQKLLNNFENLSIDSTAGKVVYEQRLYRNPYIGMLEIQRALADSAPKELIPMFQGVPIGAYRMGKRISYRIPGKDEIRTSRFLLNKYKLDFWLQPVFAANFGYREKTLQSNTSLLLQTQFYLWKGMALNAGVLFPITNDLDDRPRIIRPAPVFLNQFLAFGKHFVSASAGYFYNDQYGVNVQYRRHDLAGPWSFGLEGGLTGLYYYTRSGIYYENMDNLLLIADVAYRLPQPDVTLKLSGGRYLAGDEGGRLDLIRQFTNVEVGLYVMKTNNGTTAGFNFAVPIPPGKIAQGKKLRFRTTDEFRWEYSYTRGFRIGERYRTGYQLDQKLRQYHTDYLNRQKP